jgi:hypothetical protein
MAERRIAADEWRWVAIATLLVLAASSLPYAIGWWRSTPELRFGGFLFGLEDMHSYLAKMRYGARDGWLFRLVYTSEPHKGALLFTFHLGLGKLAAWLSGGGARVEVGPLIAAYHAARVACGAFLLGVIYRFVAALVRARALRRLTWTIAAVGGGLGWLPLLALGERARLPVEFYVPEAFSFLIVYGLPHLALARGLLLLGWLALIRAAEAGEARRAWLAGLAWFGMGMIVPFYAAVIGVQVGAWLLICALSERQIEWRRVGLAAQAGMLPLVVLIYNAWTFTTNPVFKVWSAQNRLPSPPPFDYILAFGVLIGLAAPAVPVVWRRAPRYRLLISWPLAALLMAYLPINVQRRLLEGVIVPLAMLAAAGLALLVRRRHVRAATIGLLLALVLPSTVILISGGAWTAATAGWPVFHPADELAALDWLRREASLDEVALATFGQANVIPAYAGLRVYAGHGPETVRSGEKRAQVEAFFGCGLSDAERRRLLSDGRVRYVLVGPREDGGCFDPAGLDIRRVYRYGDFTIYEASRR